MSEKVTKLYRIMPIHFLISLIEKKRLVLPRIENWEDPGEKSRFKLLETYFEKYKVDEDITDSIEFSKFIKKFYGLCFTRKEECDAMWRVYSQDTHSVKIATSILLPFKTFLK